MKASVVIPVWNGELVIAQCLEALFTHSGKSLLEVICVNNGSQDASGNIIKKYSQVNLLEKPVNLGFAGGVNAGIKIAQGDICVLVNQDCLVHDGWLTAVTQAFTQNESFGIVGGTIFNQDGSIDHTKAYISKLTGYGIHETAVPTIQNPQPVEYVTGALFAIRRRVWETVGLFDDDFYPGYFEESDYCYRARHKKFETVYVPGVEATHLRSSLEWQKDPLKHSANQHRSRYRFIAKHFSIEELNSFFTAESSSISAVDTHINQNIGRLLAIRDTLRNLGQIAARRQQDLDQPPSSDHERLLSVGFSQLLRHTWNHLQDIDSEAFTLISVLHTNEKQLLQLQLQEYALLSQIYFKDPQDNQPEPLVKRLWRLLVLRPLSIITLRDYFLLAKLNTLQTARIDQLSTTQRLLKEYMNHRLDLLEKLTDYEYR